VIPDGKKIIADYLRAHSAVVAQGARVVGKLPDDRETPWVRVTQIDASKEGNSVPEHLINYLLQLDCFVGEGAGQPQARTLARMVRDALDQMPGVHSGATVAAAHFVGMAELLDTTIEPARDYVALTAEVYMHG
jgi:hypothetical protein